MTFIKMLLLCQVTPRLVTFGDGLENYTSPLSGHPKVVTLRRMLLLCQVITPSRQVTSRVALESDARRL